MPRRLSAFYLGIAKVEVDGLGMAYVQDPIRLRREAGPYLKRQRGHLCVSAEDFYLP